jgi:ArsR family transcriptional regulator, arsenate/arsenite/antimonite-responsive transcriptional repressor
MSGKNCAGCFQILSDETRIHILKNLQERSANVTEITREFGLTQPTISYHLRLLDEIGLLAKERRGRETYYSFNKEYPCKDCGVFSAPIKFTS